MYREPPESAAPTPDPGGARLTAVDRGVWEVVHPFRLMGFVPLGHRMTVLRLASGRLLLHSPVPWSRPLAAELSRLGPVGCVVAPSLMHDLWLRPWFDTYPDATFLATAGFEARHPELPFGGEIGTEIEGYASDGLSAVAIDGMPRVNETVLVHQPSRSLIVADLVMNLREPAPWPASWLLWASGVAGRPACSRLFRAMVRDRQRFARSIERVLAARFERVIPGHGAIVERDGPRVLEHAFGWLDR